VTFRLVAFAAILVSFFGRVLLPAAGGHTPGYGVPFCRLDGIAVGLIVATLQPMRSWVLSTAVGLLALLLLGAYVWTGHPIWFATQRFLPLSIVFGVLLYASVSHSPWRDVEIPGAEFVAALSYSLYLVHPILAIVVGKAAGIPHPAMKSLVFIATSLVASISLRYAVELPALRFRDRRRVRV
jgi:peptidoglycan/LPS O-acetylase OafA/YrhL